MEPRSVLWIQPALDGRPEVEGQDWRVERRTPGSALQELSGKGFDAIVLDLPDAPQQTDEILEQVLRLAPDTAVIIRVPTARISDAVRWAHRGACHVLNSGENPAAFLRQIWGESSETRQRTAAGAEDWASLMVGSSLEMRRVCHIIRMVGARRATVLITGESGTGKELAARALHLAGPRRLRPLVAVNCSALPEALLEAELFGHVRGAFTGAVQTRIGRFEQAQSGTLFLDEIGELPLDLQAKLLRVLQEREIQRLGSGETICLDVRVVAATNGCLERKIEQGEFREDLYYRLNVVPLHLPPLRQRHEDIPALANHFARKICGAERVRVKTISADALQHLSAYCWPGNVRQLENAVEMAIALSGDRTLLVPADFPLPEPPRAPGSVAAPSIAVPDSGLDYEQTMTLIESSILQQALEKTGGNKKAAAAMLRLKRTTLSAKVRSLESQASRQAGVVSGWRRCKF